eukprot:308763-Pleurochrysis_carterae.AAC.1
MAFAHVGLSSPCTLNPYASMTSASPISKRSSKSFLPVAFSASPPASRSTAAAVAGRSARSESASAAFIFVG